MKVIPVHTLQAKDLDRGDFELIALDPNDDYEGEIPHRHNFYELMIFTNGGGIHEIDFKEFPITSGSVHFVAPTQVHKLKSTTALGFVICFKEEFLNLGGGNTVTGNFPFYDFTLYAPTVEVEHEIFTELVELVQNMQAQLERGAVSKRDIISSYLGILLFRLKDFFTERGIFEKNAIASIHPKIQEYKALVEKHYIDHYTIFQYAAMLNISSNYLNALCKKETGSTAILITHERLLLEAKRLLYSTRLSVKEISHLLHFDTDAYFVRFFKKNVGQTPLDYRTKLRGN